MSPLQAAATARLRVTWRNLGAWDGLPSYRHQAWQKAVTAYNAGDYNAALDWALVAK